MHDFGQFCVGDLGEGAQNRSLRLDQNFTKKWVPESKFRSQKLLCEAFPARITKKQRSR